jgi:hypothetical protein
MASPHPHWEELYRAAILEVNAQLLPERIDLAMLSLRARLEQIRYCAEHRMEQHRIENAMHMLNLLRTTDFGRSA